MTIKIDNLYATNRWLNRASDATTNVKNKLSELTEDYVGKSHGYELIVKKELANSYVLVSYFVKYDRQPIRFTFQFYKPTNQWLIYKFTFDADIDDEIEIAAKLYYTELKN